MFVARDERNRLVYISAAVQDKRQGIVHHYFCPGCHGELIVRDGTHQTPCFAHKSKQDCDDFAHTASEWYRKHSEKIPVQYLERPITYTFDSSDKKAQEYGLDCRSAITHIADACIANYVIELQDKFLSQKDFLKRQYFFEASGHKVIWIFNVQRPCMDNRMWAENLDSNRTRFDAEECVKYFWANPTRMLDKVAWHNSNCIVIFELQHGYWESQLTQWNTRNLARLSGKPFYQKIVWVPNTRDQGIKNLHIFIGANTFRSLSDLVQILVSQKTNQKNGVK